MTTDTPPREVSPITPLGGTKTGRLDASGGDIKRRNAETAAHARGELWTIQIAFFSGHARAHVEKGRIGEVGFSVFRAQNANADMLLKPTTVIGSSLSARQQACKLADVESLFIHLVDPDRETNRVETPELPEVG